MSGESVSSLSEERGLVQRPSLSDKAILVRLLLLV
jgi:hypothetical protein